MLLGALLGLALTLNGLLLLVKTGGEAREWGLALFVYLSLPTGALFCLLYGLGYLGARLGGMEHPESWP